MESILTKLRYDSKWVIYGFVDAPFLREQSERYDSGVDRNTEHYRYQAFRRILDGNPTVDDITIDRYVELAEIDDDRTMASAALAELIRYPGLTQQQFTRIKSLPAFSHVNLQRIIEETQLIRDLDSDEVSEDVFDRAMKLSKSSIQRKLLNKSHISIPQLEMLMNSGASTAIRNLAKEKLRRRPQ